MKEKLLLIIRQSSLTVAQQSLWESFLRFADNATVQNILDVIENSPEDLAFLTKNLEEKNKAISSSDGQSWNSIIEEEKKYIQNIE